MAPLLGLSSISISPLTKSLRWVNINFLFIENAVNPIEESLLGFGLKPSNKYFSVIRVGEDMNKYKTSIRKSYKSLVNWGMKNLEIQNLWININVPGSYNELHNHVGSVLSGVYYVDASEGQGNIQYH